MNKNFIRLFVLLLLPSLAVSPAISSYPFSLNEFSTAAPSEPLLYKQEALSGMPQFFFHSFMSSKALIAPVLIVGMAAALHVVGVPPKTRWAAASPALAVVDYALRRRKENRRLLQNGRLETLERLALESPKGKFFFIHVPDADTIESIHWVSQDTVWRSGERFRLTPLGTGDFGVFVSEEMDQDYQFAFAIQRKGRETLDYEIGDYPSIKDGVYAHARRDTEREELFSDRQAIARRLQAAHMTPAANLLLRDLWFNEVRHGWYFPSDTPLLRLSAAEAIQTFGEKGMRLVQRAIMLFVPQHAERVRHWDQKAFDKRSLEKGGPTQTWNLFVIDYLREILVSGQQLSLTLDFRKRLFNHMRGRSDGREHLLSDVGAASYGDVSDGARWVYLIDRVRTTEQLAHEMPYLLLSEIREKMNEQFNIYDLEIQDSLLDKPASHSAVLLGQSGIAVLHVTPLRKSA